MGVSYRCPRMGGLGQGQYLFLRRFLRSKKTKFGGGGTPEAERFAFATGQEARAGKNSFPPTPFLFARPSENYQKSASGFSLKKVRILFKTDSQVVKFRFPASLGASPLASADEFSSNFQTSQSFFARRANTKRQFSVQKRL